jgi:ferritin-like metal-binding protein YciE
MNDNQKSTYLAWLNDAHAMELGLVVMLQKQQKETESMPEAHAKITEHLEETKRHAERIEACITRLGGDPSLGKDWLSQAGSAIGGMFASMPQDAMVKNVHSSYASEHFEIATYTLLSAAATQLGDTETAAVCEDILKDEVDMANWLLMQLPVITAKHLQEIK